MRLKHQWYVCIPLVILLLLAACGENEPAVEVAVATEAPAITPTTVPRHGELIFVEFFAIT